MSLPHPIDRRAFRAALLVFLAAFGVRAALLVTLKPYRGVQGDSEVRLIALSIAREGVFGNPFAVPTGPTADCAPVFPWLTGQVYRVFGTGETGELAANLLNLFTAGVGYALIPILAAAFGLPLLVGVAAGLAGALLPLEFFTELRSYEPLATVLLLIMTVITWRTWQSLRFSLGRGLLHGIGWALLILTHATCLLILLAWLAAAFLLRRPRARVAAYAAGVLITAVLLCIPWSIRNYYALGGFVPFRSNFPLELYNSNNPRARVTFHDYVASGGHPALHPATNRAVAEHLRAVGELEYNRECKRAAMEWIRNNPSTFAKLTLMRVFRYWFPASERRLQGPVFALVTILGFAGLYPLWKVRRDAAILIVLAFIVFPPVYYVVAAQHFYRLPLQPYLLLCAALLLLGGRASARAEL